MASLTNLISEVQACTICKAHLPLGPRPVIQIHPSAKILIAGQAPGTRVHQSGIPFDDPSGNRLREWLGITSEVFYDPKQIAILAMGFCYPGTGKSGDLPPRPECAPAWRHQLVDHLNHLEITLAIGQYAQTYYFDKKKSVTEQVKAWQDHWPTLIPLPHPSPRNNLWLKQNPWFEIEVLPALQKQISQTLSPQ